MKYIKNYLVVCIVLPFLLSSCSVDEKFIVANIEGSWEEVEDYAYEGGFYRTRFTFNADNTGSVYVEESYKDDGRMYSWDATSEFVYKQKDDLVILTVTTEQGTTTTTSRCRVEGNQLHITHGIHPDGSENSKILTRL